ncbi:MAG: cation transporter [Halobacteriovoraceae bacterium]|nr:cation transporter [Halobacteriovoraceae bacterium]
MNKLLVVLFFLSSFSLFAEDAHVKVKGMVCAYCTTGVEKVFKKQEAVKEIKVDMDQNLVSIFFKEGKNLDDSKITTLITDSGFNVAQITRGKLK